MIYVIQSSAYIDKNDISLGFENILKIGYTKEDSKKSRFDCYLTENPTIKILYLIEGGTEEDERNLHYKFRKYLKYGREWFSMENEILDFFKTHTTVESLKELEKIIGSKESNTISLNKKEIQNIIKVNTVLNLICSKYDINYKELENQLYLNIDQLENYLGHNYPDISYEDEFSTLEKVSDIIHHFYSIADINERYRYMCSLDEPIIQSCLPHLPSSFVNYYTVLGADKMRGLGFHATMMKNEYNRLMGNQEIDIKTPILNEFKVGDKISKTEIKERLRRLYESVGYNKTPKAIDLGEYFIIKNCKIVNLNGTRDNGFEIIKRKD